MPANTNTDAFEQLPECQDTDLAIHQANQLINIARGDETFKVTCRAEGVSTIGSDAAYWLRLGVYSDHRFAEFEGDDGYPAGYALARAKIQAAGALLTATNIDPATRKPRSERTYTDQANTDNQLAHLDLLLHEAVYQFDGYRPPLTVRALTAELRDAFDRTTVTDEVASRKAGSLCRDRVERVRAELGLEAVLQAANQQARETGRSEDDIFDVTYVDQAERANGTAIKAVLYNKDEPGLWGVEVNIDVQYDLTNIQKWQRGQGIDPNEDADRTCCVAWVEDGKIRAMVFPLLVPAAGGYSGDTFMPNPAMANKVAPGVTRQLITALKGVPGIAGHTYDR